MTRLSAPSPESLKQCEAQLAQAETHMGYRPNDVLSLCHWPELLQSLGGLVHTVLQTGEVDPLKRLIGIISSRTQGCTYCTAHSSYGASQLGVDAEKIAAVFEFETSPLFTDAERAVLRVAWHGALQPNAVTDEEIEALKAHFSDREIVEIVAVLSLYGFLNRWNGTLNTELEAPPAAFAASLPE
ncbi:MAG: carboxymuconolactone decarboxylase family protein [Proteobacteria bacterium]|nr:carboxymuconolactone decarboxylase family protein [Pseudomonadota bacterium]